MLTTSTGPWEPPNPRGSQGKGNICSQKRVARRTSDSSGWARCMSGHHNVAKQKRKFVVTTDSRHELPVAENKLNQQFSAAKSHEKVGH
jgi:hypothetical protein